MSEVKKYRLGNQPEEYELKETYLAWKPEGFSGWSEFHDKYAWLNRKEWPATITLVSPNGSEKVDLNFHQWLTRDAFPMSLCHDERAKEWWGFLKVSVKDTLAEQFVIPMYPMT
jgi:hypothetical protein